MGNEYRKENQNVYFKARKEAAEYNDKLSSREGAAELLGVSPSTLADYELGNTKFIPVDKVVLMADLYNKPELKNGYCKHECPIGRNLPIATQTCCIEGVALRILKELDDDSIIDIKKKLIEITEDGKIDESEVDDMKGILSKLDDLALTISELRIAGTKALRNYDSY